VHLFGFITKKIDLFCLFRSCWMLYRTSFFLSLTSFYLLIVGVDFTVTLDHTTDTHWHTHTHTHRWVPLDEGSAHRRDLYLTTLNTHKRQVFMPSAGFEPVIPASERKKTHVLVNPATGICKWFLWNGCFRSAEISQEIGACISKSGSYYENLYMLNYLWLILTSLKTRIHRISSVETTNLALTCFTL
jgi:hypothetical protein